jgi:hypothetical protein
VAAYREFVAERALIKVMLKRKIPTIADWDLVHWKTHRAPSPD